MSVYSKICLEELLSVQLVGQAAQINDGCPRRLVGHFQPPPELCDVQVAGSACMGVRHSGGGSLAVSGAVSLGGSTDTMIFNSGLGLLIS
jgi:hypothetical protein